MSGYKRSVLNSEPIVFWTFDGDQYDEETRELLLPEGENQYVIMDEIDRGNDLHLYNEDPVNLGYRMGMPSLIELEQTDNRAISLGYYGKVDNIFHKAVLVASSSDTFKFPDNGSFTVEFVFCKYEETTYKAGVSYGLPYKIPLIKKDGVFEICVEYIYNIGTFLNTYIDHLSTPLVSHSNFVSYLEKSLWGVPLHYALIWDVQEVNDGEFEGIATVMLNGRVISQVKHTKLDEPWNSNVDTDIEIGGLMASNDLKFDRNRGRLDIDQIAIYDKALTPEEIATHYKKIYSYERMIFSDFAKNLWTFGDNESTDDFVINPTLGTTEGIYAGDNTQILRRRAGPKNIPNSYSTSFIKGGYAHIVTTSPSGYVPFDAWAGDRTYEFWFSTIENKKAILFSIQGLNRPHFTGPIVKMNSLNGSYFPGTIEFTDSSSNDETCSSNQFNDFGNKVFQNNGNFNLIHIIRRETQLELWINGKLESKCKSAQLNVTNFGQLVLLNGFPGDMGMSGSLSYLAFYKYALDKYQILSRWNYTNSYRIKGIVTLYGTGYQGNIRVFRSTTGEFLKEVESSSSGEYEIELYDNSNVDLMVFSKVDKSVRYKAYGPITPGQYSDNPIVLS